MGKTLDSALSDDEIQDDNEESIGLDTDSDSRSISDSTSSEPELRSVLKKESKYDRPKAKGKGKGKGKGKRKKRETLIKFDGETFICKFCKKDLKNRDKYEQHLSGDTKCALKKSLEKAMATIEKVKKTAAREVAKIQERLDKIIEDSSSSGGNAKDSFVIPDKNREILQRMLTDFEWPRKQLDEVDIDRYKKLYKSDDEAFPYFFNTYIQKRGKSKNKNKAFARKIKNKYGREALIIKRDNTLYVDSTGIIGVFLKDFYFKPHKMFEKKTRTRKK